MNFRMIIIPVALFAVSSITRADCIELVMPPVPVSSTGDRAAFSTPIDYQDGHIAVAQVELPDANTRPGYLRTVIHLGTRAKNGSWQWRSQTINRSTLLDPYHTQPSVAFDREGYIHITYNMHHLPWQYAVSRTPYDLTAFDFRGDPVSQNELDTIRVQNKTHFPDAGNANIPGNQITYPAFVKNRTGELHVVYRYALRPAKDWAQRSYATGLAKYDETREKWDPIGTPFRRQPDDISPVSEAALTTHPFLFDPRYLPYLVTIAFDSDNGIHAIWTWWDRDAGADGSNTVTPSYRYLPHGNIPSHLMSLATTEKVPGWAGGTVFNTSKSVALAANGDVLAIFEPRGKPRQLIRRSRNSGRWGEPIDTPNSASKIRVTRDGTEWLFASGLKLFKRAPGGNWSPPIPVGSRLCEPWPLYNERENAFYIRAKDCSDAATSVVYRYQIQ